MVGTALSTTVLFVLASFYVYFATKTEIHIVYSTKKPEGEIGLCYGCLVIIMSSCVLVLLYYFADKFIFQIIFTCLIFSQITLAVHLTLRTLVDYTAITRKVSFTRTMLITKCNFDVCSCVILLITIALMIIYWYTKHWILNNVFSFCLCYTILSLYHFTSFRMCLVFLALSFVYDVFWVYVSPAVFSGNVMVFAATSVDLPIKLEVPVLFNNNSANRNTILLGLGDIVIPGFTVKFLKRFDFIKKAKCYYAMGMKMYFIALVISGVVAFVFNAPQPVLFYMCPCLVFGTVALAYNRGEVKDVMFSDRLEQKITMDISRERTGKEDNEGDVRIEMGECEGRERRRGNEEKRKRGWRRMKGRRGYKRKRIVKEINIEEGHEDDENEFEEIEDNDDNEEECDYEQMGEKRRKKRRYI